MDRERTARERKGREGIGREDIGRERTGRERKDLGRHWSGTQGLGKAFAGKARVGSARTWEDIGRERKGLGRHLPGRHGARLKTDWGLKLRIFSNFSLAWSGLYFETQLCPMPSGKTWARTQAYRQVGDSCPNVPDQFGKA